ncbi:hypothetical protein Sgri01_02869 [Streptomyces griseus]
MRGEVVEVLGGVGLGAEHLVDVVVGEGGDDGVGERAGGVDDGGQRVRGVDVGEDCGEGVTVCRVAGDDVRVGSVGREVGGQFGCAGGVGASSAEEQQVAHAVCGDEVPGEEAAEGAGAAGDEDGALGVDGGAGGVGVGGYGGEARCADAGRAEGELRFAGGEGGGHGVRRRLGVPLGFEELEATGVLGLRGPYETPDGGVREGVAAGDEGEPRGAPAVVGEPTTDQCEYRADEVAHVGGVVGQGERDDVGSRAVGGSDGVEIRGPGVQEDDVGRVGRGREAGDRLPHDVQEVGGALRAEGVGGRSAQGERLHAGDGGPVGVGEAHAHGVVAGPGELDAQVGRTGGVHLDAAPRERQPQGGGVSGVAGPDEDRVERRVEGRRVQQESFGFLGRDRGDLGVHLVSGGPHGAQPLEGGAVSVPCGGDVVVEGVDRDGGGTGRRPGGEAEGRFGGVGRNEGAGGVARPRGVAGVVPAGVHGQGAAAVRLGGAHGDLDGDGPAVDQFQRRLERELGEPSATDLVARAHREFHVGRAGQDDVSVDGVVGEPRVVGEREAPGQQGAVGVGEPDDGSEQRMVGGAQSGGVEVGSAGRRAQPVVRALEGVRGQVDGASVSDEGCQIDGQSVDEGLCQGRHEPLSPTVLTAQGPDHRGRTGLLHTHSQNRVSTALHEGGQPIGYQRPRRRLELDGLPEVPHPVRGIELLGVQQTTGHRRIERDRRRTRNDRDQDIEEFLTDRLHVRGMRRVVDRDTPDAYLLTLQGRQQLVQRSRLTRHHRRRRAVDGGNRQAVTEARNPLPYRLGGQRDRRHTPTPRQTLTDHPTALSNDPGTVLQGERTGDDGRGYLTLRMTHHRSRHHTERLPQPGQRHHHRPGRGLHHIHPAQTTRQLHPQIPPHERRKSRSTLPQRRIEHRERISEFQPHTRPLRTLPRKHEHRPRTPTRDTRHHTRLTRRSSGQGGAEGGVVGADDHGAVVPQRPRGEERVADVCRTGAGVLLHVGEQAGGLLAQALGRAGGQRPGNGRGGGGRARRGLRRRLRHRLRHGPGLGLVRRVRAGGLFENDVGVGAADTEGGDARAARTARLRPLPGLRQQRHITRGPVDMRRRLIHMQRPRQHTVPHRHHHLDHTSHTRSRLRMTDVRLQRTQQQRSTLLTPLPVRRQQRLRLDRITQPRPRTVRLHRIHIAGGDAGVGEGADDDVLLRLVVGGGEAVGRAVLVHGRTPHHRQHPVPVAQCVGEALHQEEADSLGGAEAVGALGERLATAVGGQALLAAEIDDPVGGGHHRDTAGQGHGALALAERLYGEVQGDQRRRARGVDGHGGAAQAEGVRDPAGHHTGGVADGQVALHVLGCRVAVAGGVVLRDRADEDADVLAAQCGGDDAGALHGLPGGLQQQPLLRVHRQRLTRRDPEEPRVELGRAVQETAPADVAGADPERVGVEECVEVPTAVGGQLGDSLGPVGDHAPQVLRGADAAGEAAGHAHDGDGLAVAGLRRAQTLPGLPEIGRDALQVVAELLFVGRGGGHVTQLHRRKGHGDGTAVGRSPARRQGARRPHGDPRCR